MWSKNLGLSPYQLASVKDCPRNLPLKFGQNQVIDRFIIVVVVVVIKVSTVDQYTISSFYHVSTALLVLCCYWFLCDKGTVRIISCTLLYTLISQYGSWGLYVRIFPLRAPATSSISVLHNEYPYHTMCQFLQQSQISQISQISQLCKISQLFRYINYLR